MDAPGLESTTNRVPGDPHPLAVAHDHGVPVVAWASPAQDEWALGFGVAHEVVVPSHSALRELLAPLCDSPAPVPGMPGPWFGGVAFAPAQGRGLWSGFGVARFVVPERLLWRRDGATWLTRFRPGATQANAPAHSPLSVDLGVTETREHWDDLVTRALQAIRGGTVRKVVVARAKDAQGARPWDPLALLQHLGRAYPHCRIYLHRAPGGAFLVGATPEVLCRVEDRQVWADALAGSRPPHDGTFGAREHLEHELVVDAVAETLRPQCISVDAPTFPSVMKLPNVWHLHTPITGILRPQVHPMDVALGLHPTPAVGGVPRAAALSLISEAEGLARGWYAGPVGCLGGGGLHLCVALRCALVDGNRARVFVGAGIVDGSTPAAEWDETERKAIPMLEALRASEGAVHARA
ncbi:MAG: isochorismate synthase [Myxococcota bacterium]